ncbi:MAG: carbohydrate ABC transporter permease [Thermomicrobiales bacterium]
MTASRRARAALIYGGVALLVLWTAVPLYWLGYLALSSKAIRLQEITPLLPWPPTTVNFAWLLSPTDSQADFVRRGFANSLLVAVVATLVSLAVAVPGAYAVRQRRLRGVSALLFALFVGRVYPPVAFVLPLFWLYARLALLGTWYGLAAAYVGISVLLALWLLVGVFGGLSPAVLAAARVDGNTPWQTFVRVALPLARPGIAAAAVVVFVGCWNEFALAQFLTAGSSARTFPVAVAPLLSGMPHELAAASVVGILPTVALVCVFRRSLTTLFPAPL